MLVSSTCSLNLGLAPRGEELTMETVMAVCSGGQENEKRFETQQCLHGERYGGPLRDETNLSTEQGNRAHSHHLPSLQQQDLSLQPQEISEKFCCGYPTFCSTIQFMLSWLNYIVNWEKIALLEVYSLIAAKISPNSFFIATTLGYFDCQWVSFHLGLPFSFFFFNNFFFNFK